MEAIPRLFSKAMGLPFEENLKVANSLVSRKIL